MILKSLVVGQLSVNCFILACEETREGIVVDPGDDIADILNAVQEDDIRIVSIVATHGHFDHIGRAKTLIEKTGAPFAVHKDDLFIVEGLEDVAAYFGLRTDPPPQVDRFLENGEAVRFGKASLEVLHTPGHSPGGISLAWPGHALVGDLVFAGSVGRTDFEGGNTDVLLASVRERIFPLGDDTHLYPGHGPFTTVGQERKTNPFLTGR